MTLIEAIKSGRPFKRQLHADSTEFMTDRGWAGSFRTGDIGLLLDEILADDWILQEPTVTITRTQFWDAIDKVERLFWPNPAAKEVARHLGLEPDA